MAAAPLPSINCKAPLTSPPSLFVKGGPTGALPGDFKANGSVAMTGNFNAVVGSAALPGISFAGDTDTGIFEPGANTLGFSTNGIQRMTIDQFGNVGIGSAAPGVALDIVGSARATGTLTTPGVTGGATGLTITSSASNNQNININTSGFGGVYYNSGWGNLLTINSPNSSITGYLTLDPATGTNSPTLSATGSGTNIGFVFTPKGTGTTIFSSGNVGIGTTTPGATLDVKGHIANSGTAATVGTCGTSPVISGNDTRGIVTLGTGSPTACTVTFNAAYTSSPHCVITPYGGNPGAIQWWITASTTTLVMNFSAAPTASQQFEYQCMQ